MKKILVAIGILFIVPILLALFKGYEGYALFLFMIGGTFLALGVVEGEYEK